MFSTIDEIHHDIVAYQDYNVDERHAKAHDKFF